MENDDAYSYDATNDPWRAGFSGYDHQRHRRDYWSSFSHSYHVICARDFDAIASFP